MEVRNEFTVEEVQQLRNDYPELYAVIEKEFPQETIYHNVRLMQFIMDLCPHCYSTTEYCHCWNDD